MTSRLENALRQLPPDQIEKVAEFAESLARRTHQPATAEPKPKYLKLDWVGMAADAYPEHASGVEAAHAVGDMIRESIDRSRPR